MNQRFLLFLKDRLSYAKFAAIIMWLAWIGWLVATTFWIEPRDDQIFVDHMAFYSAGRLIGQGDGLRIYDAEKLSVYQPAMVGKTTRNLSVYRNPPFYALWFVPSSKLSYFISFWIWSVISLVLLWLGIKWLRPQYPRTMFLWALSFYPVFAVVGFGQNSLYSFGILCGSYRLMRSKWYFWSGAVLGILLYKPQLLLGICIWWLIDFRKYWRCYVGLAFTGLITLLVSWIFVWPETLLFLEKLPELTAYAAFDYWNLHNPRGFWTYLFGDDQKIGHPLGTITSVLGLGLLVRFCLRNKRNELLSYCGVIAFTLFFSPHTMIYEWCLLLIPAILLWEAHPTKRDRFLPIYFLVWFILFVGTPFAKWQHETIGPGGLQITVPVLAFAGFWMIRELTRPDKVPIAPKGN